MPQEYKVIRIECRGAESISIDDLKPFQDDLKSLSKENYEKFKKQILKKGFNAAISVWQHKGSNYILDGHQRLRLLQGMKAEGYAIDKVPCDIVEAPNFMAAKQKIPGLASQFGTVEKDGLYKFYNDYDIDMTEVIDEVNFPEIDQDEFIEEYMPEGNEPQKESQLCPHCGGTI